jgi:protoheme IX farnesyltransferase
MHALWELTKPKITRLVLIATAAGFYLASRGNIDVGLLVLTLIGTALVASGTNALNMWWERDIDAKMLRTRHRPLPAGRVTPSAAVWFALAIALIGVLELHYFVNELTALLAALTLTTYVLVYTPLKQRTPLALVVGSVPGALPILGGWTAAGGTLVPQAWALFWILFLWQVPHFLALAWLYRRDYARGGLAALSVFDSSGRRTGRQAMLYSLALVPVSLLPTMLGLTGQAYFLGALLLGIGMLACGGALAFRPSTGGARRLFLASVAYLPVLLLLMVVDKV